MSTAPKTSLTDEQKELATRYVLGELSDKEFSSFEARYSADAEFRRGYNDWAADLDAQVAQEPLASTPPAVDRLKSWFRSEPLAQALGKLGLVPAVVGAFAAALLVVFATNMGLLAQDPPVKQLTADLKTQTGDTLATIAYQQDQAVMTMVLENVLTEPDRVLEVWLIAESPVPLSVGALNDDERQHVLDLSAVDLIIDDGDQIEVTEEPVGGAGAAGPTGEVIASGVFTTN